MSWGDKFTTMGLLPFQMEVITGNGQPEKFVLLMQKTGEIG